MLNHVKLENHIGLFLKFNQDNEIKFCNKAMHWNVNASRSSQRCSNRCYSRAISGAVIGAITEGIKTGSWEGALKGAITGAVNGAADGFMFGAIGGAVSGALNPKFCFVAGTLVMTKQGLKAIEEIQKGDLVLSYNDNLGIYDYKDVVDVYENEATELCHIKTANDEIVCTPNHSILTDKGWLKASEIRPQDNIQTTDGFVEVLSVVLY